MKGGLCIIYTSLLTISVLSSCALFILVVSEALQGEGDNVDLSGLSNVSQKVSSIEKDEIPEILPETTTYEPDNKKKKDLQQQEMIFAETLSVNSVTTDGTTYANIPTLAYVASDMSSSVTVGNMTAGDVPLLVAP
ncbi:hypothetical protein RR46_03667 [Papilio xuthus]|uniref:Uncharacterized protein n=1 Tax=Papilio xuthus TaxID=66420 RepID=A0A194Q528_PAPXU|nr:hypothetical protein RR46_03667 [Papilio xuthus]